MDSIMAVKEFINGETFIGNANIQINQNGNFKYLYRNVCVKVNYNIGYMQMDVSIDWEDDKFQKETYKERGLRGIYNTNFQTMRYKDANLIIDYNDFEIILSLI